MVEVSSSILLIIEQVLGTDRYSALQRLQFTFVLLDSCHPLSVYSIQWSHKDSSPSQARLARELNPGPLALTYFTDQSI